MTPPNQRDDKRRRLTELSNRIHALLKQGNIEQACVELAHAKEKDPTSNLIHALEREIDLAKAHRSKHQKKAVPEELRGYTQDSQLNFEGTARILETSRQMIPSRPPRVDVTPTNNRKEPRILDQAIQQEIGDAKRINEEREKIEKDRLKFEDEVHKLEDQRKQVEHERLRFVDGMQKLAEERKRVEEELRKFEEEAHKLREQRLKGDEEKGKRVEELERSQGNAQYKPTKEEEEKRKHADEQRKKDQEKRKLEEEARYFAWQSWGGTDSRTKVEEELHKRQEQRREMEAERVKMEKEAQKLMDEEKRIDEQRQRNVEKIHELELQSQNVKDYRKSPGKVDSSTKTSAGKAMEGSPQPPREKRPFPKAVLYGLPLIFILSVAGYFVIRFAKQPQPGSEKLAMPVNIEPSSIVKGEPPPQQQPEQKKETQSLAIQPQGEPATPEKKEPPAQQPELKTETQPALEKKEPAKQGPELIKETQPPAVQLKIEKPAPVKQEPPPQVAAKKTPQERTPKVAQKPVVKTETKVEPPPEPKQQAAEQPTGAGADEGDLTIHTVKRGETLESIARLYSTTVENIKRWNLLKTTSIKPGQDLYVYVKKK